MAITSRCGCADEFTLLPNFEEGCKIKVRTAGANRLIFKKCIYAFIDPTDIAEWEAAIASGDVVLSAKASWEKPTTEIDSLDIGCNEDVCLSENHTFPFTSYSYDDDGKDSCFWQSIEDNQTGLEVIPVDCEGRFYLNSNVIDCSTGAPTLISPYSGEALGYPFSFKDTPPRSNFALGDKVQVRTGTVNVEKKGDFIPICIPGVYDAILAA